MYIQTLEMPQLSAILVVCEKNEKELHNSGCPYKYSTVLYKIVVVGGHIIINFCASLLPF